ncbi:MAG: divalent metal cation transporter [bacterium]
MGKNFRSTSKNFLEILGPGLITGASDDDPSGIATYSQAGAQFGFRMLWTLGFTFPLMLSVQVISARIGRITGCGISANIVKHYNKFTIYVLLIFLIAANTLNLGADIGAMGEALRLIVGGPALLYATLLTLLSVLLQIFLPYRKYVSILRWLTLVLFSYVATLFTVHVPWVKVLKSSVVPSFSPDRHFFTTLIAVFGTTISPYLFFWQASQEVEEEKNSSEKRPLKKAPKQAPAEFYRIKLDTAIGMAFSNFVAFAIMLATAVTLHANGIVDIDSAAQAAEALRPAAGNLAFLLFTFGILGTGLLALPILAGSTAYAVGELFGWEVGLDKKPSEAKGFYAVVSLGFLLGLGFNLLHFNPIKALYWSAVLNGIAAVPIMVMMMLLSSNKKVVGDFVLSPRLKFMGWLTTVAMAISVFGMFLSYFF